MRLYIQIVARKYFGAKELIIPISLFVLLLISFVSCAQSDNAQTQDPNGILEKAKRNTVQTALQQTLDNEYLQWFLDPNIPGREILYIAGADLPDGLQLEKHGKPVEIVQSIDECEICLIFDSIIVTDSTVVVSFRYPTQGVVGHCYFAYSEWHMILDSCQVHET